MDDRDRTGDLHPGKVTRCLLRHIHMEPSARFELAPFSVPGRRSAAGATKAWTALRELESNQRLTVIQSHVAPAVRAPRNEPLPGVEPGYRPYKGQAAAGPKGVVFVCPVRFERTLSAYSAPRLLPLVYEHVEPSPGADPGLLPYGGKVTSRV